MDFGAVECSRGMYAYCFVFFLLIFLLFFSKYNSKRLFTSFSTLNKIMFCLILAYVITSFYNGDFWHYKLYVIEDYQFYKPSEPIYDIIKTICFNNYLLFRIVIWGSALLILTQTLKKYKLNINMSLYFFFCMYISVFDYGRVSLAMAIYFLGFTYLFNSSTKSVLVKVLGIILMILSSTFHHSLYTLIILSPLVLLPLNKKSFVMSLLVCPFLIVFLKDIILDISTNGLFGISVIADKVTNYSEYEVEEKSLLERLRYIWLYSTFYLPFIISTFKILFTNTNQDKVHAPEIIKLYRLSFYMIYLTTMILFLGFENQVLFYRNLFMLMIPLTILISYLRQNNFISSKTFSMLILLGVGYSIFRHSKVLLRFSPIH